MCFELISTMNYITVISLFVVCVVLCLLIILMITRVSQVTLANQSGSIFSDNNKLQRKADFAVTKNKRRERKITQKKLNKSISELKKHNITKYKKKKQEIVIPDISKLEIQAGEEYNNIFYKLGKSSLETMQDWVTKVLIKLLTPKIDPLKQEEEFKEWHFKHSLPKRAHAIGENMFETIKEWFDYLCSLGIINSKYCSLKSCEIIAVYLRYLYITEKFGEELFLMTVNTFSNFFDESILRTFMFLFKDAFHRIFPVELEEQSSFSVNKLKEIFYNWKDIRNSKVVNEIKRLFIIIASACICQLRKLPFNIDKIELLIKRSDIRHLDSTDMIEQLFETFFYLYEKCTSIFECPNFMSFFHDDKGQNFENEFALLLSCLNLMQEDKLHLENMDRYSYASRVDALLETCNNLYGGLNGVDRKLMGDRICKVKNLQVKITEFNESEKMRKRPFSILLFGSTGVGKSSMLPSIINNLCISNGFSTREDTIVTLQADDKFESEYRTRHSTVILDDIANANPNFAEGNHTTTIIKYINNVPCHSLSPIAELKGKIVVNPAFFIGTTNIKNLNVSTYSNAPLSVLRRFNYTITVELKKEFTNSVGQLATHLMTDIITPAWLFTVEIPSSEPGNNSPCAYTYKVVEHEGKALHRIELGELLRFLSQKSKLHFAEQELFLSNSNVVYGTQLCEHGSYHNICDLCLDEQSSGFDFLHAISSNWLMNRFIFNPLVNWIIELFGFDKISDKIKQLIVERYKLYLSKFCYLAIYYIILYNVLLIGGYLGLCFISIHLGLQTCQICLVIFNTVLIFAMLGLYSMCVIHILSKQTFRDIDNFKSKMFNYRKQTVRTIAVVGMIYALYKFYKAYKLYFSDQSDEIKIPDEDVGYKGNPWKSVFRSKVECMPSVTTMTTDQADDIISKNIAYVEISESADHTKRDFCNIFPLKANYWILPWHVLKKYPQGYLRVNRVSSNLIGPNFSCSYGVHSYKRVGSTDLCIIYLPVGGTNKDLTNMFPLMYANRSYPGRMIYKYQDGSVLRNELNMNTFYYNSSERGVVYSGHEYRCKQNTFGGQCMATFISCGKTPIILGFHLAGEPNTTRGISQCLTYNEIQATLNELCKDPFIFQSTSSTVPQLEFPDLNIFVSDNVPIQSPSNYLDEESENIQYFGAHTGSRSQGVSRVIVNPQSPIVELCLGIPNKHGPPRNMRSWKHWQASIQKNCHIKKMNVSILKVAYNDLISHVETWCKVNKSDLISRVHPLPNVTIINGKTKCRGVESINKKSSTGFPYKMKKMNLLHAIDPDGTGCDVAFDTTPEMWNNIHIMEQTLLKGERIHTIWSGALKDEITKLTKEKVRVFACCSMEFLLLTRKYFLMVSKLMMENSAQFECAVGVDAHGPSWTQLTQIMCKFGEDRIVAGDYKDFDSSMSPELTSSAFNVLIRICELANFSKDQILIMRGIATEIIFPMYEYNGEYYQVNGSNPSGHPLTVFINNICNSLYMRYAYYDIMGINYQTPFHENVSLLCYGDDNKMSVKLGCDSFNHSSIAHSLFKIGVVYTMADKEAESVPFINNSECSFLKRMSIWNDDLQEYMAPLEIPSIVKSLHCSVASKELSQLEQFSESVENANREFFYHGYDIFSEKHAQLNNLVDKCNIRHFLHNDRLMTFDEYKAEYILKYKS